MSFLRDAEIESMVRLYATPLFKQAGVDPDAVAIHIVNDMQLNAFVAVGLNLFLNAGLIIRTETPSQLVGVIAHESGHIAGGHLSRFDGAMSDAGAYSWLGTIMGIATAVAGRPDVGMGVMQAGNSMAERSFLAFSRGVEASADSAAMTFLDNLHQSSLGLYQFMQTLEGEEVLLPANQDPYLQTHPLTPDRVEQIRAHVATSPWSSATTPPAWDEMLQRSRAKLYAFLEPPATTLAHYPLSDTSLSARYARAIAYYRIPDLNRAIPAIDSLIQEQPDDPYFHELKGQMLYENGRVSDAVADYRKAATLLPENALIRQELGQADIETQDDTQIPDAIASLKVAANKEPDNADSWRLLSIAYDRAHQQVASEEALAEYSLYTGDFEAAIYHATRAGQKFKPGSPDELRMGDVRVQALQARDREKKGK